MRLSSDQIAWIRGTVAEVAGEDVRTFVFGSRLRDGARGGDLDLLVETGEGLSLLQRARIKLALENRLGMPVDITTTRRDGPHTPFQKIALAQGELI